MRSSWVDSANSPSAQFPLDNLPYGVFSIDERAPHCAVAIGDQVLDVAALEDNGLFDGVLDGLTGTDDSRICRQPGWNTLMARGPAVWSRFRQRLQELLADGAAERQQLEPHLYLRDAVKLHMPFVVAEFTDFYAGRQHATNVGTLFRGAEPALPPNWLHMPIGYNGRASSVVVSGTDVRRPWGQLKSADHGRPAWMPSRRFDFELELGAIVGQASAGPVSVDEADAMLFGYVLLNDWSARDIQAWEYQPLGPFLAKATATSISPWIVTAAALAGSRLPAPERDEALLPYLQDTGPMFHDIDLEVLLAPEGQPATTIATTNSRELYYSAAQQLAHHASSGCPMRIGDLLGSGTISGPGITERGSLLELSWGGREPLALVGGETRTFLENGDTLTMRGSAQGAGYRIGFGECTGTLLPALDDPDH